MTSLHTHRLLLSLWALALWAFALPAAAASHVAEAKKFVLVIDAGHGGKDAGALGTYSKEKDINLRVALELGRLVEKNCPDVKIVYTRRSDVFVELNERANIANRNKADLFISVHTNALPGGRQATGSETYTLGMARSAENLDVAKRENSVIFVENDYQQKYEGFDPKKSESYIIFEFMQDEHMKQSVSLARDIQKHYVSAGRKNKGVHQAGFLVLRKTSMPSVLTELGFITTPSEEAYLNSTEGVSKLARSIYQGFADYKQRQDGGDRSLVPYKDVDDKGTPVTPEQKATEAPQPTDAMPKADTATTTPQQQPAKAEKRAAQPDTATPQSESAPSKTEGIVFKVQILSSNHMLRSDDSHFKGEKNIGHYREGNLYKYTCGHSTSYKEIVALQQSLRAKFPDAFVIAFDGDEKITLQKALQTLRNNKPQPER